MHSVSWHIVQQCSTRALSEWCEAAAKLVQQPFPYKDNWKLLAVYMSRLKLSMWVMSNPILN